VLVEKGPQTVADTQERLKLMTAGVSLKAQGLAYADASAKYVEGRLSGALEPAAAISDSLRETAQANIARSVGTFRYSIFKPPVMLRFGFG